MSIRILVISLFIVQCSNANVFWDAVTQTVLATKEPILKLNISRRCAWQLEVLYDNVDIVYQMLDASAKFPYASITDLGRTELGDFDRCLAIDSTIDEIKILGKYCYAGLVLPDFADISNISIFYKLATCTPSECTASDLLTIGNYVIPNFPPILIDEFCTTKETGKEISLGTFVTIGLFILVLFLMIVSTLYDFYCNKVGIKVSHPLLVSFSVITNTNNILRVSLKPSDETIQTFSGFRIISVAWVIAAHGVQSFTTMMMPAMNMDYAISRIYLRYASYMFGANHAVTTFFFMSGFLVGYLYFKRKILPWKMQVKYVPLLYLHRYIRITAPVLMLYLVAVYLFKHMGNGPLWQPGCQTEINNCKTYWWSYFLYIQNYANWDQLCIIPLWYISADMQLFILAPLVLIPISIVLKSPGGLKLAMLILAGLNFLFLLVHIASKLSFPEYTKNAFDTHGRLPDYFIGIMMGIFMRFAKSEPFLGKIKARYASKLNVLIWIIVLSLMFVVFIFTDDGEMYFNRTNKTLYYAVSRVIWAVGLCWIVYSCYHGYGGIVNWILCLPIFQVGAKLTYSMYLLHYLVLGHFALSNRTKFNINDYVEFYLFCGYFIETFVWSFLWTLAFESPIITIEKYIFSGTKLTEVNHNHNTKRVEESCA
ncbi:unnamed protein product [Diabrotica balteata]|uniref:Nose resistant-to-fluoxetine protein N-terminal domain-containing protein n=1 Tax=Diabrotica balteata TaxID=107213 RepID=A0A9N9SXG5_DIABA|nr:unnamed protein product [Diabrotica balteata]